MFEIECPNCSQSIIVEVAEEIEPAPTDTKNESNISHVVDSICQGAWDYVLYTKE